ncbi:MAG: ThiF family adenylyltransferase [Gammaproteobacteria bacterium]|nr:ThiF family adenylyltransferase [Gammaproteobacteria bacterium]NND40160.1 thiamine biosynthesis protein ThiF [Pseudomonadales bacterium]
MSLFSQQEYLRYSRHIQLAQFGAAGQMRLKQARVLIVGCGGLGAPVALYLAGAGVGHISLVDADQVSITNLHRQIGFSESDIGRNKAQALAKRLRALNSDVDIQAITAMLCNENAQALIEDKQLIIDCSDRFEVRCLINQHCLASKTSWIYASAAQYSGQLALFVPGGPCYRCLFPEAPQNAMDCNAAGVLGTVPGILGTLQADQSLHYLAGQHQTASHVTMVETAPLQVQQLAIARRPDCNACGATSPHRHSTAKIQSELPMCNASTALASEFNPQLELTQEQLRAHREREPVFMLDVRSEEEHSAFNLGGLNIPLHQIGGKLDQVKQQASASIVVCYCQSGARSLDAAIALRAAGVEALSLAGGIQQLLESQH